MSKLLLPFYSDFCMNYLLMSVSLTGPYPGRRVGSSGQEVSVHSLVSEPLLDGDFSSNTTVFRSNDSSYLLPTPSSSTNLPSGDTVRDEGHDGHLQCRWGTVLMNLTGVDGTPSSPCLSIPSSGCQCIDHPPSWS